jgi:PIN domain nuclease of toxin-antitoxin system
MNLLLDTHILLWWLSDDARLPATARTCIAREAQSVFVSTASLWEIAVKSAKGKLRADVKEIHREIERSDFIYLPIEPSHVLKLRTLPARHADPFDRMLVAQAASEGLTLLTCDEQIRGYGPVVRLA